MSGADAKRETSEGASARDTRDDLIDVQLSTFSDTASFRFAIENTCFGEGKYFVNVSVLDSGGRHLKDAIQAASFNVTSPQTSRGAIAMKYSLDQTG